MIMKPLAALSSVIVALCATPLILGASAQTHSAGTAARVTLVPSLGAAGSASVSAGASASMPSLVSGPALAPSALAAAATPSAPSLTAVVPAAAARAVSPAPIAAVVSVQTLSPVIRPEAGREAEAASALNLTFDASSSRPAALETPVFAAASVEHDWSDAPSKLKAPLPPANDKDQEKKETGQLLKTARTPAIVGTVVSAIAGAVLGAMGGAVGAVIGSGLGVIASAAGIGLGGYLGARWGVKLFFGQDLLGLIKLFILAGVLAAVGGFGGFFGGAALGIMGAKAGGILGSLVGVLALAPIGAAVGGFGAMLMDVVRHPEKYPQAWKELKKP